MTTVLGGGIGGLAAAYYYLQRRASPVIIYEATERVGGWIRSDNTNKHDGFLFESGPRTIRTSGPAARNTLKLIEDIGLEGLLQPIRRDHVAAKNRMIYAKKNLCLLPSSFGGIFKTMPPFSQPLVMAAFKDLFAGRSEHKLEDESIYDFCARRFGPEIATYAISSMICGICAGDAKEISVKFLMKSLFEKEQKYGGVMKGMVMDMSLPSFVSEKSSRLVERASDEKWSIYSLTGGMETFPRVLNKTLKTNKNYDIKLKSQCTGMVFTKNGVELIINGEKKLSNYVVSSIPSNKLAPLVADQHPYLANQLNDIPLVDVAVINLQYNEPNLLEHQGFGFLVPPIENLPILGVIFDSCCFDMKDNTVLTVMMGGKWFKERFGDNPDPEGLLKIAIEQVHQILNLPVLPTKTKINILKTCIPQYVVGHHKRVENIRNYINENKLPLGLCGASYDGVGVNDVILSSKKLVDSMYFV